MPQQGKCNECEIRYVWKVPIPLHRCRCPQCEAPLKMSRKDCNYPTVHQDPIIMKTEEELKIDTTSIVYRSNYDRLMYVYKSMSLKLLLEFRESAEVMKEQKHGTEEECRARIDVLDVLIEERKNETCVAV